MKQRTRRRASGAVGLDDLVLLMLATLMFAMLSATFDNHIQTALPTLGGDGTECPSSPELDILVEQSGAVVIKVGDAEFPIACAGSKEAASPRCDTERAPIVRQAIEEQAAKAIPKGGGRGSAIHARLRVHRLAPDSVGVAARTAAELLNGAKPRVVSVCEERIDDSHQSVRASEPGERLRGNTSRTAGSTRADGPWTATVGSAGAQSVTAALWPARLTTSMLRAPVGEVHRAGRLGGGAVGALGLPGPVEGALP